MKLSVSDYRAMWRANQWHFEDKPIKDKIEFAKASSGRMRLLSLQRAGTYFDICSTGSYDRNSDASLFDTTRKAMIEHFGFIPVITVHPLTSMSLEFNPWWLTSPQFQHELQSQSAVYITSEWKDMILYELEVDTSYLNEVNTTDMNCYIPSIAKSDIVAMYQVYICDKSRVFPTTDKLPYVRVLRRFKVDTMIDVDFSPATLLDKYTGDDEIDFGLE